MPRSYIQKPYNKFALIYDNIYDNNFYVNYAFLIKKIIQENKIAKPSILDIACGSGRLIKELKSKYKYKKVEGCDASKEMLAIARKRNKTVRFYNQNFTSLSIRKKYNVITCTFDAINYITNKKQLYKTFKNIKNHLSQNGIFIFDFNTVHKQAKQCFTKNNVVYHSLIQNKYWNLLLEIKINKRVYIEKHTERLYSYNEMKLALGQNNFEIINLYSNFNKKIKSPDNYPRLFIIAKTKI